MITKSLFLLTFVSFFSLPSFASQKFTITSGTKSAMYYPVATSICKIYNKYSKKNVQCIAAASKGASSNLNLVDLQEHDMGIAQNVIFDDAIYGQGATIHLSGARVQLHKQTIDQFMKTFERPKR